MIHEAPAVSPDPLLQRAACQWVSPSDLHGTVGNWCPTPSRLSASEGWSADI